MKMHEEIELADNAMLKKKYELFYEWNFKENDKLGLDVYRVTFGSKKMAWWNCPDCRSNYDMEVYRRKNQNCPYCSGHRVNHTNSLASLDSKLTKEWHPTLNGELTPHDVTLGRAIKVWWLSKECGHEWDAPLNTRTNNKDGCPYCSNHRILIGFNDMWTTNPELARQLLNPEDGYKYTQSSNVKVSWKCLECNEFNGNRVINSANKSGFPCIKCSDGFSFPEKYIYNLLKENNVDFEHDVSYSGSGQLRYDFHLPDHNCIVEVHGAQHYEEGFSSIGGRTLREEQKNDRQKEQLAKENGIDSYIVIDARHSTIEWIKDSILNSDLMNIINKENIDFEKIGQLASKTLVKEACDLWMNGIHNIPRIAEILNLSSGAVRKYLKRGVEIGWCDYCPKETLKRNGEMNGRNKGKCTIQLSQEDAFIKEWRSISETEKVLDIKTKSISNVCRGKLKTAGGFKWMYKEDYERLTTINERN